MTEVFAMQKHLFPCAWIFAALVLGILACLIAIAWMLLHPPEATRISAGAHFVREVLRHATA